MVLDAPGGRVGEPKIPAGIGRERERERERGEETATLRSCQSQPAHQKSIKIIRRRGRRRRRRKRWKEGGGGGGGGGDDNAVKW